MRNLWKGLISVMGAMALGIAAMALPAQGAGPSTDCNGYPEPRAFVEAQSWWSAAPGQTGNNFGHVHLGACIPERQTLSANTSLWVRVLLHDNPGKLAYASLVLKGTDYETTVYKAIPSTTFSCPVGTCERWFEMPVDLTKFGHSGLQEIRFRAFVDEPDGKRMTASLNWQATIANGKSKANVTRQPYLRGKGWYTGFEYCEPDLLSVPLPMTPLSGLWQPKVQVVNHEDSVVVSRHFVSVDPDFHAEPPRQGTVLKDGSGQLVATTLSIDTTQYANGSHKLHLRADCVKDNQMNSGVLVVPFTVSNPVPTPPPAPSPALSLSPSSLPPTLGPSETTGCSGH